MIFSKSAASSCLFSIIRQFNWESEQLYKITVAPLVCFGSTPRLSFRKLPINPVCSWRQQLDVLFWDFWLKTIERLIFQLCGLPPDLFCFLSRQKENTPVTWEILYLKMQSSTFQCSGRTYLIWKYRLVSDVVD